MRLVLPRGPGVERNRMGAGGGGGGHSSPSGKDHLQTAGSHPLLAGVGPLRFLLLLLLPPPYPAAPRMISEEYLLLYPITLNYELTLSARCEDIEIR